MELYHLTSMENFNKIIEDGFLRSYPSKQLDGLPVIWATSYYTQDYTLNGVTPDKTEAVLRIRDKTDFIPCAEWLRLHHIDVERFIRQTQGMAPEFWFISDKERYSIDER